MVENGLNSMIPLDLTISDNIDEYVQRITQCLTDAIDHLVPKRYPWMLTSTHTSRSQQKPKSFREVISSADGHQAAFRWSKAAQLMAKPADLPYCPDFQYSGKCAKDGLEKSIMYMDAIYGPGNTSQTSPINPDLPDNLDCSVPSDCTLNDSDIVFLIKDLPNRKSSGVDIIGNEALKMVANLVAPHLVTLFNACMSKGYCPTHFKRSKTILFLKPGKKADNPKAYRPIALLSSIGKIFEKFPCWVWISLELSLASTAANSSGPWCTRACRATLSSLYGPSFVTAKPFWNYPVTMLWISMRTVAFPRVALCLQFFSCSLQLLFLTIPKFHLFLALPP